MTVRNAMTQKSPKAEGLEAAKAAWEVRLAEMQAMSPHVPKYVRRLRKDVRRIAYEYKVWCSCSDRSEWTTLWKAETWVRKHN